MNAPPDTKKKALLQDTPTANVYSQLQKLASQNPACKFCLSMFFPSLRRYGYNGTAIGKPNRSERRDTKSFSGTQKFFGNTRFT